eukprot:Awhi_evm1s2982
MSDDDYDNVSLVNRESFVHTNVYRATATELLIQVNYNDGGSIGVDQTLKHENLVTYLSRELEQKSNLEVAKEYVCTLCGGFKQ